MRTIYHELGHFLAFVAGNVDRTSDFAAVYNSEKSKFTGINRSYATQNSSEYFAESVLEYVTSPSTLKRQRPKTYAAIVAALNKITDERIQRVMDIRTVLKLKKKHTGTLDLSGKRSPADFFLFCEKSIKKMSINISCNRLYKVCIMKHKLKTRFHSKKVQPCQAVSDFQNK